MSAVQHTPGTCRICNYRQQVVYSRSAKHAPVPALAETPLREYSPTQGRREGHAATSGQPVVARPERGIETVASAGQQDEKKNDVETGDRMINAERNGETPSLTAQHAGMPGGDANAFLQGLPPEPTSSSALSHLSAENNPGVITSDYGFGSSWPTIKLPLSPGDVGARVMAAENVGMRGVLGVEAGDPLNDGNISSAEMGHSHAAAQQDDIAPALQMGTHRPLYHRDSVGIGVVAEGSSGLFGTGAPTVGGGGGGGEVGGGEGRDRDDLAGEDRGSGSMWGAGAPREQVSLPEDIYGAARVSEYWHGMHALSSLASAYVYDDIWAGDGGLNPREDLIGIAAWAAGGGVAANQDQGGGGEAVTEAGEESHPGGRESAASHPATQEGQLDDAGAERRRQWRRRSRPGTGGQGDKKPDPQQDEGSSGEEARDDHDGPSQGGGARGGRKRRTPSPGPSPGGERGWPNLLGAGTFSALSNLEPGGPAAGKEARVEQDVQESTTLVSWCAKVATSPPRPSKSSSGTDKEERFFAGRVLEPAPRPPPGTSMRRGEGVGVEPDLSGRRHRRDSLGGEVDGSLIYAPLNLDGKASSALPPAVTSTRALPVVDDPSPSQATPATTTGASESGGQEEVFFSGHMLEPDPRGWNREVFAKGDAGDDAAPAVATGIVTHPLAQGIGKRGRTEEASAGPRISGELLRSSSEFSGESGPSPPPATALNASPVAVSLSENVGGTFRSVSDARAWSRAGGAIGNSAPTSVSATEQPSSSGGGGGSSWDWQVQPEAMAAFFTTVIGLAPPAGTPSQPALRHTRASAAIASSEFPEYWNAGGVGDGGGAAGAAAANAATPVAGVAAAAAAAAAATAIPAVAGGGAGTDARAGSSPGNNESCSMSYAADPGGAGGGEGSSWGW